MRPKLLKLPNDDAPYLVFLPVPDAKRIPPMRVWTKEMANRAEREGKWGYANGIRAVANQILVHVEWFLS